MYAAEGTAGHALAEHLIRKYLKKRTTRPTSDFYTDELVEAVDEYVAFVISEIEDARRACVNPIIIVEQRVDASEYVDNCFGTADMVIITDKYAHVIDLKLGKGVEVSAVENPQLMIYGLGVLNMAEAIQNDSMADEKFYEFLLSAFRNMAAHMAEGGSAYIFHADTEGLNFRRAFKEAGFHISSVCIWVKNSLVLGRSPYQWQHEPVLFGWMPNGKHRWFSDRKQTTIWNFDKPKHSKEHPTMKPIPLLAYPIKNSSAPNGVVLDLFGGSGSTLMACEQTDRICRTMELDPRYASVIVMRYAAEYGTDQG